MSTTCIHCKSECRRTSGREIYPHRSDLYHKVIYVCDACDARVGCHGDTDNPLGYAANPELRNARILLHNRMLDPLWKKADEMSCYDPEDFKARKKIRRTARVRVYEFLADRLGLELDNTHTGMFDLDQCRAAWVALRDQTPESIRDWARDRRAKMREAGEL